MLEMLILIHRDDFFNILPFESKVYTLKSL